MPFMLTPLHTIIKVFIITIGNLLYFLANIYNIHYIKLTPYAYGCQMEEIIVPVAAVNDHNIVWKDWESEIQCVRVCSSVSVFSHQFSTTATRALVSSQLLLFLSFSLSPYFSVTLLCL